MAKLLKLRRGTTSQHSSFTGAEGEVTVDTDKEALVVHNGSTAGGFPVARADGTGVTNFTITGELDAATLDISGNADIDGTLEADAYTVDGTALNEYIADTVGAMVTGNTETGIAVTYEDGDNTLDFVVSNATGLTGTPDVTVGVVTAGSLDISGDADIDGTLEADAYTVNGTALDTHIAGVTVANATNCVTAGSITVADSGGDANCFPMFTASGATGNKAPKTRSNLAFNSNTGLLSTTAITTTGNVIVGGNLQVDGTTTTVNSSTMTVTDKNIEIAKGAANDAAADGAGITVDSGDGDKTWNWVDATDAWTSSEHIHLIDNKKLFVGGASGTTDGLEIYHDTSDSLIKETGTGSLQISAGPAIGLQAGTVNINNAANDENMARFFADGAAELYHNNVKKIETTAAGVTVTGTVTDSLGNVRQIPSLAKSSAHTLVATDAGQVIYTSSGGVTVNNSVFSAGDAVTIINNSGSDQTITQGSGVTMYNSADAATGNRTLAQRGMATIWFASASVAYISGGGLS